MKTMFRRISECKTEVRFTDNGKDFHFLAFATPDKDGYVGYSAWETGQLLGQLCEGLSSQGNTLYRSCNEDLTDLLRREWRNAKRRGYRQEMNDRYGRGRW